MAGHIENRTKTPDKNNRNWTIVIDLGRDPLNKKRRLRDYIPFHGTKKDAKIELARLTTENEKGTYVEPSKYTFGEYLKMWLKEYAKEKVGDKTYEFYENMFNIHTIPQLGPIMLDKLKPLHLQKYYNYLLTEGRQDKRKDENGKLVKREGGLAGSSVNKHHRIIHKALDSAVKWELLSRNVADAVQPPKQPKPNVSYYTSEQALKMLEIARNTNYYALLVVAVYTGARRGEILGLRWQDIDWNENLLKIRQTVNYTKEKGVHIKPKTKTESGIRDILAPREVMEVLKKHKVEQVKNRLLLGDEYNDLDLIFCQDIGLPMHPDTISSWFPDFLVANNLPKLRFHNLRHTHATILLEGNVPDIAVAERLGHADASTTKRFYGHVTKSMQQKAADAINKALKSGE